MKETTKNNIVRYVVSAILVATFLSIVCLVNIGLDWLADKTGWPILLSVCIICFVYAVWGVSKGITLSDEEEQVVKLEPSKDLEEIAKFYADTHTEFFDSECKPHVAPAFIAGAKWQNEQLKDK